MCGRPVAAPNPATKAPPEASLKWVRESGGEAGEEAREAADLFPFCSGRCKLVDLGRWLNGEYRIPGDAPAAEEEVS